MIYTLPKKLINFLANNVFDIQAYQKNRTPFLPKKRTELNNLLEEFFPDQVDGMQLDIEAKEKLFLNPKGIELETLGLQYTVTADGHIVKQDTLDKDNPIITGLDQEVVFNSYKPKLPKEWEEDLKAFKNLHIDPKDTRYAVLIDKYSQFPEITTQQIDILCNTNIANTVSTYNGLYASLTKTEYYNNLGQTNLLELDPIKSVPLHKLLLQAEINSGMRFGGDGGLKYPTSNPLDASDPLVNSYAYTLDRIKNMKTFEVELYGNTHQVNLEDAHLKKINETINKLEALRTQGSQYIHYRYDLVATDLQSQQRTSIERGQLDTFYTTSAKLSMSNELQRTESDKTVTDTIYEGISINALIGYLKDKTILCPLAQEDSYLILLEPGDLDNFISKIDNAVNLDNTKKVELSSIQDFKNISANQLKETLVLGSTYSYINDFNEKINISKEGNDFVFTSAAENIKTNNFEEFYNKVDKAMNIANKQDKSQSILFHTGRGGQFNNQGHQTAKGIIDSFDPNKLGINYSYSFENLNEVLRTITNDVGGPGAEFLEMMKFDISEAAANWNQENKAKFDALDLDVKSSDLGEPILIRENGVEACTVKELNSPEGTFNIDNDYDSYRWTKADIETLTDAEVHIIVRDLSDYKEVLEQCGVDRDVLKLMDLYPNIEDKVAGIKQNEPYLEQEITQGGDIERFDSLEELEEAGYQEEQAVEVNQRYYVNTQEQTQRRSQRL